MKLRRIKLANWCQHKDRELVFDNGIIGIVGPNGSGKSNILKAILFALTGYTLGTRIESLTHGTKTGYVELDFFVEEESTTYRVVRNIHNGDVFLYRANGADFDLISDRPATARDLLAELVPIPPDVAEQIYAVGQEEMVELLRMSSSRRSEIMQRVFSLMFFSRIYKKLRELLTQVDNEANGLEAQLLLLKDQEAAAQAKVVNLSGVPEKDALDALVKDYSERYDKANSLISSARLRDYIKKTMKTSEAELERLREKLNSIVMPKEPGYRDADTLRLFIQKSKEYLRNMDAVLRLFDTYLRIQKPEEVAPEVLNSLMGAAQDAKLALRKAEENRKHIQECGTNGTCPLCGSPITYTEKDLIEAEAKELEARLNSDKAAREYEDMLARDTEYKEAVRRLKEFEDRIEDRIDDLLLDEYEGVNIETHKQLLTLKANAEDALARETADLHARIAYDEEVARKNTEIQTLVNTIKTYEENIRVMRENPVMSLDFSVMTLERYEQDKDTLAKELENLRKQQIQRVQLDAAKAELSGIRSDIQRVQAKLNDTHPDLREKLWDVNELFRSKNFPTKVAFAIYKKLEERLNVYLSEFNAPYKVEMRENGDFDCVFDSGLHQLSARLSGGQKMVLAIAFRIALHSVFATDDTGGFVALDEPTTFLDEKNRDALCSVLNTLKTSPLFRDLQIFVVTHDDMLRPLFNCLVDLEG